MSDYYLKRTKPIRKAKVKATNPKRKERRWAKAYGSPARVRWIASRPCVVCGTTPCQNVHTEGSGMGLKGPMESVVAMCHEHHQQLHQMGIRTFEAYHGFDLAVYADQTAAEWVELTERT